MYLLLMKNFFLEMRRTTGYNEAEQTTKQVFH